MGQNISNIRVCIYPSTLSFPPSYQLEFITAQTHKNHSQIYFIYCRSKQKHQFMRVTIFHNSKITLLDSPHDRWLKVHKTEDDEFSCSFSSSTNFLLSTSFSLSLSDFKSIYIVLFLSYFYLGKRHHRG